MPYNLIAATNESTVVAKYTPKGQRSDSYQSEAALEAEFIRLLQAQGYEYLAIHSEKELIANLRRQLELLNGYQFLTASGSGSSSPASPEPTTASWKRPAASRPTMCRCCGRTAAPAIPAMM